MAVGRSEMVQQAAADFEKHGAQVIASKPPVNRRVMAPSSLAGASIKA